MALIDEGASEATAGQASFDMANLRPERTGLPFVVFISQRDGARHDVRVKFARAPKVRASEMIAVALRPAPHVVRGSIDAREFELVQRWLDPNAAALIAFWNGDIEYTEDVLEALKPLPEAERT